MKEKIVTGLVACICALSVYAAPSKKEAKRALENLRHAAYCGYTVLEPDGTVSRTPYIKMYDTYIRRLAIRSPDVFLKGHGRDGGALYTKALNSLAIVFSPIGIEKNEYIDYGFPAEATDWKLRTEHDDGGTRYFLDFMREAGSEEPGMPQYRENPEYEPAGSIELEFYRCGGRITKNLDNQFFRFETAERVFDDELERQVQAFSNVDVEAACAVLEAYFGAGKQTAHSRAALARVRNIREHYRRFVMNDIADGDEHIRYWNRLEEIISVSSEAWRIAPDWRDFEGRRMRRNFEDWENCGFPIGSPEGKYDAIRDTSVVPDYGRYDSSERFVLTVYYNAPDAYYDAPLNPYCVRDFQHDYTVEQVFYRDELPRFLEAMFGTRPRAVKDEEALRKKQAAITTVCDIKNHRGDTILWFTYDAPDRNEPYTILNGRLVETNGDLMAYITSLLEHRDYSSPASKDFETMKALVRQGAAAGTLTPEQRLELITILTEGAGQ